MTWVIGNVLLLASLITTYLIARAMSRVREDDATVLTDVADSRERDTLPPESDMRDPADLLASVAVRMERTAESLASVSRELAIVARDIAAVRQQQQTHGKSIGELFRTCERLESRVADIERRVA